MAIGMIATAWTPATTTTTTTTRPRLKSGAGNRFFVNQRKAPSGGGRVLAMAADAAQEKELRKPRPQNVASEFYVDHTCINCDTCRWMAPSNFVEAESMAVVYKQPTTKEERVQALQGVYHCGHHSEKAFGAASYLLVHPQGNILIDSPRYSTVLERNIEAMGGVRYMFLTHRDDVANHQQWAEALNCERIIHSTEVQETTAGAERKLEGEGPWNLYDDVDLIFTPGHSEVTSSI